MTDSSAVSELIYSLSNLLVLFNDQIIQKARNAGFGSTGETVSKGESKLKLLMTTLEYIEVFIEYSAKRMWGDRGRWLFIVILQLTKFIGRCILTFQYKNKFVSNPPIQTIDRKKLDQSVPEQPIEDITNTSGSFTFKLKRSGRIIRKVEGAPPVYLRNWKAPTAANERTIANELGPSSSSSDDYWIRVAEILYISKPLVHLASMALFGRDSWKSWSTALGMDISSLRLYYTYRESMTKEQRVEVSRRCVSMLLYLMRSPFYDRYTSNKIQALLNAIASTIPFAKSVCNPLNSYIPQWQGTYFYMWST